MKNSSLEIRVVYIFVFVVIALSLIFNYSDIPAKMKAAKNLFDIVENLEVEKGDVAFIALDYGPNTQAENVPQSEVVIEHLLRRRIPFAIFSQYALSVGFLNSVPENAIKKLEAETGERWEYGKDWVNIGFRPGSAGFMQGLAKATNLAEYFGKDSFGTPLVDVPAFRSVKSLTNIAFLAEFTGLVGVFDTYIQFFQKDGYIPQFGHGCTSITIPEAYIYLDSGQLNGLLEGLSGAASYSELLAKKYVNRVEDPIRITNTALGLSQMVIIFLIILGNIVMLYRMKRGG